MTITVYPPESRLFDALGNPIGSLSGAINIHNSDVHHDTINKSFYRLTATVTTLSVAASSGATSVTVTSAAGFAVGNFVHIQNVAGTIEENIHLQITSIVGAVITLDRPLDHAYAINDTFTLSIDNLIETGTLAAPISYKIQPMTGNIMHLTKITISMGHSTAGDFGTFGNIAGGLTNGVVLRRYDGTTASFGSYTIWKTNGDIDQDTGTVKFPVRSGGGGTYGTSATGLFADAESIVYLDGTAGDYIELLVQDDLSTLLGFYVNMQGHYGA